MSRRRMIVLSVLACAGAAVALVACRDAAIAAIEAEGFHDIRLGDRNLLDCPAGVPGGDFNALDAFGVPTHGVLCQPIGGRSFIVIQGHRQ